MPYASNKQAAYLHIHHPDIAAKWHEQGHGYVKGKAKKKKGRVEKRSEWTKPIAAGTAAGVLANQFPRVQDIKRKKKGRVKKFLITSDDPGFNQEAAQKAFDLVMKMDDDTAEMFTFIVVSDYFEQTVEKNLGTLQRHLNETLSKRLEDLKKAHLRVVSKGMESREAVAYAQAIALIEKQLTEPFSKEKPKGVGASQKYGYIWREQDFERDPSSGQFRAKISHNQTTKLKDSVFGQLTGASTPDEVNGRKLSYEDKVRFQDEYRQLAGFLQSVNASTGGKGNQSVMLHYRDKNGNAFSQLHTGTKPPKNDLADPDFRLMGVEARPTTLTAGGAAFGLATALGGGMAPQHVQAINAIEGGEGKTFTNAWMDSGEAKNSNAQLYGRLAASGKFMEGAGIGGPKVLAASKFAQIVGNAGPEAERVLGPSARKTAYRYRGTEKTPEKPMIRAYGDAVTQGKKYGEHTEEEILRRGAGRGVGHGSMRAAGARTRTITPRAKPGEAPPVGAMARAQEAVSERAPSWQEREMGRQVVVAHLWNKRPNKNLYELQLASGNTPPSEGVIINADGQLVTQAVGYGDDHYLPFNLKNLKQLKGGEYIRSRSVGGLTSEDIYTGLISGARQVTVVSRSGTYTMTFEPDFRGGRRHNDKARRMTRRYEQLLDAVQSQQVDRTEVSPDMRAEIEREVKEEMSGPGYRRADIQDAIKERIDEFKENPYITEEDEKRAEAIINSRAAGANESERNKIRSQVMDDLMEQKETKFRLNSAGYKAALDGLQEQFPYYISKPKWTPPKDAEKKLDPTLDLGYVEPGANRPTAAAAGLFGAKTRHKYSSSPGKFSAAEADYQRTRGTFKRVEEGAESAAVAGAGGAAALTPAKEADRKKKALIAEEKQHRELSEAAKAIQDHATAVLGPETLAKSQEELTMSSEDLKDKAKREKFNSFATRLFAAKEAEVPFEVKLRWENAYGARDRQPFDKESPEKWPKFPATFDDKEAYLPGAKTREVNNELNRLDSTTGASLTTGKPLSSLTDGEMAREHEVLHTLLKVHLSTENPRITADDMEEIGIKHDSAGLKGVLKSADKVKARMTDLHRTRALVTTLGPEGRAAREKEAQTIREQPATTEERTKVYENAKTSAEFAHKIADQLDAQPDKDEAEIRAIRLFADEILNNIDDIRSQDDFDQFLAKPDRKRARFLLLEANGRLNYPKP